MNKLDSYLIHSENKRRRLATEQDVEAALQLIQLKDYHRNIVGNGTRGEGRPSYSDQHLSRQIHEPFTKIVQKSKELLEAREEKNHDDNFMKMVLKSKEFLQARHNKDNNHISNSGYRDIRKRKSDGIASCSSSITFDLDDNSDDEDANEAFSSVKKRKKFRSIGNIYNVTKPF